MQYAKQSIRLDPTQPQSYLIAAQASYAMQDRQAATEYLEQAQYYKPLDRASNSLLAKLQKSEQLMHTAEEQYRTGELKAALATVNSVLECDLRFKQAHILAAQISFELKDYMSTVRHLKAARLYGALDDKANKLLNISMQLASPGQKQTGKSSSQTMKNSQDTEPKLDSADAAIIYHGLNQPNVREAQQIVMDTTESSDNDTDSGADISSVPNANPNDCGCCRDCCWDSSATEPSSADCDCGKACHCGDCKGCCDSSSSGGGSGDGGCCDCGGCDCHGCDCHGCDCGGCDCGGGC